MPNIATALRDEIKRLSRQQSRTQIDPTKRATAVHRRDIALLKRQVVLLERQVKSLMRRAPSTSSTPQASVPGLKVRFVAKGLRSSPRPGPIRGRSREGAGLSARSVYNWESGKARLRHDQIAKLSQLRKAGKHQVVAFLPQQGRTQGKAATQ